jgi:hypothetical protein
MKVREFIVMVSVSGPAQYAISAKPDVMNKRR